MHIRPEQPGDEHGIRAVHIAAFERETEADLVDQLRATASPLLSLVAIQDTIIAHLMCSPVVCKAAPAMQIMGLAPMAVLPKHQRTGIGSALVSDAVERCGEESYDAIIVLGHPAYYRRFGFQPASNFGIQSIYGAPDEAFMALELDPGSLRHASGQVRYHAAFDELE